MLLAPWPWGLTVVRAAGSESGATRWPLSGWLMGQTLQHGGAGQFFNAQTVAGGGEGWWDRVYLLYSDCAPPPEQ